jgi:hypothetical protein
MVAPGGILGQTPDGGGHAAGHAFADDEDVGAQRMDAGVAAEARGDGMRLVDDEKRAVFQRKLAKAVVELGLGQDHAGVGHHRFGQDRADVALGEGGFDAGQVIEFAGDGGLRQVVHLAEEAGGIDGFPVLQGDEGVIHSAVVAAVEHEDLGPAGDGAGDAECKAVGVGRGGGDLPAEGAEAVGQKASGLQSGFGGQHVGQAAAGLLADGFRDGRGRMAEHRPGVAKAEVVEPVAVDILDPAPWPWRPVEDAASASRPSSASARRRGSFPAPAARAFRALGRALA